VLANIFRTQSSTARGAQLDQPVCRRSLVTKQGLGGIVSRLNDGEASWDFSITRLPGIDVSFLLGAQPSGCKAALVITGGAA